jgi:CO/xanthine dehydrogenase FAD-binding subunit
VVTEKHGLRYVRAGSVEEAVDLLGRLGPGYRPIAGGTDLLVGLRRGWYDGLEGVIDISRINRLREITQDEDETRIGSCVTHAEASIHPLVCDSHSGLAEASAHVGSPQIRNRGTVGGNVVGAAPCADTIPPLVVADSVVHVECGSGERRLSLSEFVLEPYRTVLAPDELVTGLLLPRLRAGGRWGYQRLARRGALDRARASVVVLVWLDDEGRVGEARIACGAVLSKPRRLVEAEAVLPREKPSPALFEEAAVAGATAVLTESGGRWSAPYKEKAIATLIQRALEQATGREGSTGD